MMRQRKFVYMSNRICELHSKGVISSPEREILSHLLYIWVGEGRPHAEKNLYYKYSTLRWWASLTEGEFWNAIDDLEAKGLLKMIFDYPLNNWAHYALLLGDDENVRE